MQFMSFGSAWRREFRAYARNGNLRPAVHNRTTRVEGSAAVHATKVWAMSRVVTRGLWLHTQLVGWSEIMRLRGTQKPCRHDKYKLARLHGMLIAAPQGVLLSQTWIALCQAS